MSKPIVFLSYSRHSADHPERVLDLAQRLRSNGVETILDQYLEDGEPDETWPRWMLWCSATPISTTQDCCRNW